MIDTQMVSKISLILLLVGGISLGLEGLLGMNVITAILGKFLGRLVFILIGVAAGYLIYDKYFAKAI